MSIQSGQLHAWPVMSSIYSKMQRVLSIHVRQTEIRNAFLVAVGSYEHLARRDHRPARGIEYVSQDGMSGTASARPIIMKIYAHREPDIKWCIDRQARPGISLYSDEPHPGKPWMSPIAADILLSSPRVRGENRAGNQPTLQMQALSSSASSVPLLLPAGSTWSKVMLELASMST